MVNAGSSSLKLRLVESDDRVVASADLPALQADPQGLHRATADWPAFGASGHRVVHGGNRFLTATPIDDAVVAELDSLNELAPLHNPPAIAGIRAVRSRFPDLPAVACFDTTFHTTLAPEAAVYGIPWEWTERLQVRRFGFHGLSYAYTCRRAAELLGRPAEDLRMVICHLGAGASLAAVDGGRSVDTTMGFTPLEGLIMATRSGSVDPGALLWLQRKLNLSPDALLSKLEHSSGLRGMAGSGDMREILDGAERGEPRAQLALGAYTHRVGAQIAAMSASMGALDAVVFTGGVGERSPRVRALACHKLGFLGVEINEELNHAPAVADTRISASGSPTPVLLVHTREELQIASEVRRVLDTATGGDGRAGD